MLSKLKPKDQTVNCPQCQSIVYVPVKMQQKIRVTCKKCRFRFELQMQNPLTQHMDIKKSNSLKDNTIAFFKGISNLPWKAKLLMVAVLLIVMAFIYVIGSLLSTFIPLIYKFIKGFFSA